MTAVFAASVSRTTLGLPDLDINDHQNFYVSNDSIFSGTVQQRKISVTSPWVASSFIVSSVPDVVEDVLALEVLSAGLGGYGLQTNLQTLIQAFTQTEYNLTFSWDSAVYTWACQPCDYSIDWTQGRGLQQQVEIKFSLYRSPVAINGV